MQHKKQMGDRVKLTAHNSSYPKSGGSCFKDSLVVTQTFVFQIKFCGENRHLRVASKRYAALLSGTPEK